MVTVPTPTPVTKPEPTVAIPELLLDHVPPPVTSERLIVLPLHTTDPPNIVPAFGDGLTFTLYVAIPTHPAGVVPTTVYTVLTEGVTDNVAVVMPPGDHK
jgi:hypothetical protein